MSYEIDAGTLDDLKLYCNDLDDAICESTKQAKNLLTEIQGLKDEVKCLRDYLKQLKVGGDE